MIRAEQLSFSFPHKDLYNNLTFTIEENRHCAFIGSNGTGKSTLINMIRNPEEYMFDGKLKVREHIRIGYVSQYYEFDEQNSTTVFDYLSEAFIKLQADIDAVCSQMGEAEDIEPLMEKYQKLLDQSDSVDADHYDVNIRKALKLASLEDKEKLPMSKLSGGEYKLICIMKEMLSAPELLIMDEPDGFLDFDNMNSLIELINHHKGTMLVVTHNRYLLNHCFDQILHLENKELQEFDGSYMDYNYTLLQTKLELQEQAIKDEAEIERNKQVVEKLRAQATYMDNAATGRQLHARVSHLALLEARKIKAPFLEIREPDISLHTEQVCDADAVLTVLDYSSAFEEKLLEHVNFTIANTDKAAIVGANGTGKTTLLRHIFENADASIQIAAQADTAFLSQMKGGMMSEERTVLEEYEAQGFINEAAVRTYLSKYCFDEDILYSKIGMLSGGEKNLLQLDQISRSNANLLLLDEPTSHLDIYAQIALEKAVSQYNGAILMVSHDFYTIVNCMDYVLLIENKTIRKMSIRAFRKMIYSRHFNKDYLELEQKKKSLELRVNQLVKEQNFSKANTILEELEDVIKKLTK